VNPNILMLLGGVGWLIGELWGVYRNSTKAKVGKDTTSQWVWWLEARVPLVRVLVGMFVLSLFGHFLWRGMLLP
jgi:hypothetical protein